MSGAALSRVRRGSAGVALAACLTLGRFGLRLPHIAWRVVWRSLLVAWFVFATAFLLVRYVAAPQVSAHRVEIAERLSRALGVKVEIARLEADWNGLRPELLMRDVRVFDKQGREALKLPGVDVALAWSSLLRWQPELHRLRIRQPELAIRREANGTFFIAGMPIERDGPDEGSRVADLLLSQHEIRIDDARITWDDRLRQAPTLALRDVSLLWQNSGTTHRFAALATPVQGDTGRIDVRGDLRSSNRDGRDVRRLANWQGALYLAVERADLSVWQKWIDYPIALPQGRGALRTWLNFEGERLGGLTADVALADVRVRLAEDLPMLELDALSGRLRVAAREGDHSLSAERLSLTTRDGLQIGPTRFSMRRTGGTVQGAVKPEISEFQADKLDMRVLAQLAAHLPIPAGWRERIARSEPRGKVAHVKAKWESMPEAQSGPASETAPAANASAPQRFELDAAFEQLALAADGEHPGFENLTGSVTGTERSGQFRLSMRDGALDLPGIMHEPHIPIATAETSGQWQRDADGKLSVRVPKLVLSNPDISHAEFSAAWHSGPEHAGSMDMTGRVQRFNAPAAWRYIPHVVPVETSHWLQHALTTGVAENVRVKVEGDLAHFPFRNTPKGVFKVEGRFAGIDLAFGEGWPVLARLDGDLLFERTRMRIRAQSGHYRQARLGPVVAEIADLENVREEPLRIKGQALGPGGDMLHYLQASPVARHLGSFVQRIRQDGDGALDLQLTIPLLAAADTRVEGSYRFDDNTLYLTPALPPFQHARGVLAFNEHGIGPTQASAQFLGGQVTATGRTLPDGVIQFDASGQVPVSGLSALVETPAWSHLSGQAQATTRVTVGKGRADVVVNSNLVGLASDLPPPLGKVSATPLPFTFSWGLADEASHGASVQDWRITLEGRGAAQWQDRCNNDSCNFARGAVALNDNLSLPARGLRFSGKFKSLDLDQWRPIVLAAAAAPGGGDDKDMLSGAVLQADEVLAAGHRFAQVTARAVQQGDRWVLRLEGPDIAGDVTWAGERPNGDKNGRLSAKLSTLVLRPVAGAKDAPSTAADRADPTQDKLPALDVSAERFQLRDMRLGKLSLHSETRAGRWQLSELRIESPDAVITGEGSSGRIAGGGSRTDIALDIDSQNLGGFLARIGYPDALRKGHAAVRGKLSWNGPPTSIDYASLGGTLHLDAGEGEFNKLEPGAARLLGILSLQSLPRRITLDFRDVFSEGFAFDSIRGDLRINDGVMHSDNLEIRGPAARVFMRGSTDIAHETHALRLTVQPSLSDGIAIGVTVLNPVVGVATYLAQKVLRDPFEKIFSFDYSVTGSWSDPKIEKESIATNASAPVSESSGPGPR